MRFVNLSATSERVGKGHRKRLILRKDAAGQSAALPVLAFGDADTGFFQSSDDVLELTKSLNESLFSFSSKSIAKSKFPSP